jgi:hypothetical protein
MPEKAPADPTIRRKPARRGRILPVSGAYFVHVMSRVVNRDFILGPEEKAHFRKLMRQQAEFARLEIVTDAIMDNHFHILLHVQEREVLDDAEIIRRLGISTGNNAAMAYRHKIEAFLADGQRAYDGAPLRLLGGF